MTDKAVSKWECGYCLPDNSVMQPLCNELGITVNELLSGERLTSADYNKKAEENIMTLINENNKNQNHSKRNFIFSVIAAVAFIVYIIASLAFSTMLKVSYLIDFVSFNEVVVITLLMLVLAGRCGAFGNIFRYSIRKCDDNDKLEEAIDTASYTIKSLFVAAGITSILYFIAFMAQLTTPETIGPNLAVMILGWFYALVFAGIILVLQERLKKKLK